MSIVSSFFLYSYLEKLQQPLSVLYQILVLLQQLSQPVALPTHSLVQDQMRVSEHTGVEQTRVRPAEEMLVVSEECRQGFQGLARPRLQRTGVDVFRRLEQLVPRGLLELKRQGSPDKPVGGRGLDVDPSGDGVEVRLV